MERYGKDGGTSGGAVEQRTENSAGGEGEAAASTIVNLPGPVPGRFFRQRTGQAGGGSAGVDTGAEMECGF